MGVMFHSIDESDSCKYLRPLTAFTFQWLSENTQSCCAHPFTLAYCHSHEFRWIVSFPCRGCLVATLHVFAQSHLPASPRSDEAYTNPPAWATASAAMEDPLLNVSLGSKEYLPGRHNQVLREGTARIASARMRMAVSSFETAEALARAQLKEAAAAEMQRMAKQPVSPSRPLTGRGGLHRVNLRAAAGTISPSPAAPAEEEHQERASSQSMRSEASSSGLLLSSSQLGGFRDAMFDIQPPNRPASGDSGTSTDSGHGQPITDPPYGVRPTSNVRYSGLMSRTMRRQLTTMGVKGLLLRSASSTDRGAAARCAQGGRLPSPALAAGRQLSCHGCGPGDLVQQ